MTATTTFPALSVERAPLETVQVDVYRDVHKGIRSELFALTTTIGATDPTDTDAVRGLGTHWHDMVAMLLSHAEHEDRFVQPLVVAHAPGLADRITEDHRVLEDQMAALEVLADRAAEAAIGDRRLMTHRLYLGFASFTSAYLAHQEFEELEISTALAAAVTPDVLWQMHGELVASIPPDEMAAALGVMLPAMNVDDRTELIGGIQATAPAEVFTGILGLAEGVLAASDYAAVARRLGVNPEGS
jgi:hypothetical protein